MTNIAIIPIDLPEIPGLAGAELANYWLGQIDEEEAAKFAGCSTRTLQKWRSVGGGPEYIAVSTRCVRYRRADLYRHGQSRKRAHTAQAA